MTYKQLLAGNYRWTPISMDLESSGFKGYSLSAAFLSLQLLALGSKARSINKLILTVSCFKVFHLTKDMVVPSLNSLSVKNHEAIFIIKKDYYGGGGGEKEKAFLAMHMHAC